MENTIKQNAKRNPWAWIPTLYLAEGLPYVAVMTLSVIMYKRLGISNTDIALYTGWLYLPWVIKPFWSPFVDLMKTKRWWTLTMQWLLAFALAAIAFSIPTSFFFQLTLAVFWVVGFTSATHDIAADGFYMYALSKHEQSFYVGIRSTFYRVAIVLGQGALVIIAGLVETGTGLEPAILRVEASPGYFSPLMLPSFDERTFDATYPGFIYTDETLQAGTVPLDNDSVSAKEQMAAIRTLVHQWNTENGFVVNEGAGSINGAALTPKEESAFTAWVRNTFGEKREVATDLLPNIAVAGIRLAQPLQGDEEKILYVNFKNGDPSISLEQGQRLIFNARNYDKPAYLIFRIDPKIKSETSATFIGTSGNIPYAWSCVFIVISVFFLLVSIYHSWALPRPETDKPATEVTAGNLLRAFLNTFKTFFTKKQALPAILFMLFYRFPEAQFLKLVNPFLLDPIDKGGLGLTTGEVGFVYGTIGIIGLTVGGILGGIVAARGGLKKWLFPMAWTLSLTGLTYVYLSFNPLSPMPVIYICVFIEQFGYGFGFTAYMLFLIYFSEGEHKTAHYAICTGFMALGMMLPGMAAGWLQEAIGYSRFFIWTIMCSAATIAVCALVKIDPQFGKK